MQVHVVLMYQISSCCEMPNSAHSLKLPDAIDSCFVDFTFIRNYIENLNSLTVYMGQVILFTRLIVNTIEGPC